MANKILTLFLICAIGVAGWFGYSWHSLNTDTIDTTDKLTNEVNELASRVNDLEEELNKLQNPYEEKQAEIIDFSVELLPVFTAIYKTFCNLQDVVSPYGTVNTTQKVYRVETGLFTFTNYRVRLPVKEYDEVCSQLACLKLLLQMLPDKPDEMMPVKVTLAESLNHISKATSYVQFGDRLIYLGKVYDGEEKEEGTKQLNPYQKKLNEAKASYNSATDTWQSILDKYNVSYSEIGLTEPLTKIE